MSERPERKRFLPQVLMSHCVFRLAATVRSDWVTDHSESGSLNPGYVCEIQQFSKLSVSFHYPSVVLLLALSHLLADVLPFDYTGEKSPVQVDDSFQVIYFSLHTKRK